MGWGQDAAGSREADEAALEELERRQADAWGRGDGEAFAATFAEDADFVAVNGEHIRTRAGIAESMRQGLSTFMRGTRLHLGDERQIRFIGPDMAVMVTHNCVIAPGEDRCRPEVRSTQTRVAVRGPEGWLFTVFQNTRVGRPPA